MRMDLYRLVHSKSLWVFLAIIVALAAISTSMVAYVSSPAFAESLKSVQGLHVGFSDAGSIAEAAWRWSRLCRTCQRNPLSEAPF